MNICIPYRPDGNNGLELKYALRSIEKHVSNVGEVFLIGERFPDWIQNVKTVLLYEESIKIPGNILKKLLEGFKHSDTFLRWDDDVYANQPVDAEIVPYYYEGTLAEAIERHHGTYKTMIENTAFKVTDSEKYFDVHAPMRFEYAPACAVAKLYPWLHKNFLLKTLYCNVFQKVADGFVRFNAEPLQDVKFNQQYKAEEIKRRIGDNLFFSTGPQGVTATMIEVLDELYPKKSRYEN